MQLRWWGHAIFAAGYCAAAVVTVVLLAVLRPQTDTVVVVLAGAVVVLAGGLVHEVVTRRAVERKVFERQVRLREAYEDLVDMFLKLKPPKTKSGPAVKAVPSALPEAPLPDPAPSLPEPAPSLPELAARASSPEARVRRAPPRMVRTPASLAPLSPEDAETAAMIRAALAEERVEAFLQPIVGLPSRKSRFFEVLSRIRLPDDGLVLPDRYLAVAEREGMLPAIDELCFARVAAMIRETDRHKHAIGFFCNVSPQTLGDAAFLARFLGNGGDPHNLKGKLVFELSQRTLTAEIASSLSVVNELAEAGFCFSMDRVDLLDIDVPAMVGHQVHYLKLNCDFFLQPPTRNAAVDLLRRLEGQPVALIVEKIETEHQLAGLAEFGITLAQGYLFGAPRLSRRTA